MNRTYFTKYDVLVDTQTGDFLETICDCDESICNFKREWIADGQPNRLSDEQLNELRK